MALTLVEGIIKLHEGVRVFKLGNSRAIIVPHSWLQMYGTIINERTYVRLTSKEGRLIIEELDKESIREYLERNKCQVNVS